MEGIDEDGEGGRKVGGGGRIYQYTYLIDHDCRI